ncbi:MAG TPA: hypothetical protein VLB04_02900 [Methanotrichaceae archaeon]|nr:hypothetical protein [Methanotrichaceae archaeon]
MRMQKEEKIVVVLLFMALGSLAVASWAFSPEETEESAVQAKEDSLHSLEGIVQEINPTKTGGHLLIKLDSTQMPVFVPREAGADEVQRKVNSGDRIRVKGMVAEFGGKEELKVSRAADIEVI